jgi:diphthamide synthase (EF-2-diphthine--ammonia ligase)
MAKVLTAYREGGIDAVVFGDHFLGEIRDYREQFLVRHGMLGVYPVWGETRPSSLESPWG